MITLIILFVLSLGVNVGLGILLVRATRRLFQFDDLFQLLVDDLDTNIRYFKKIEGIEVVADTDEVRQATRNMLTMGKRFNEFMNRINEISNRRVEVDPKMKPPVID